MADTPLTSINKKCTPVVFTKDNEVFANSRDVAEFFEKRHADVLRAIESLSCSTKFTERNFAFSTYDDPTGRAVRMCDMTKDGFSFLAMGFTGPKAAAFKEKYIEQFNAMEAELRIKPTAIDVRDPAQLVSIATQLIAVNKELETRAVNAETKIEEDKPKTEFYDNYINSDGLYGLQNAARALECRPNLFTQWLKEDYLFYQGGALVPRIKYIQNGVFEVKSTIVEDKVRPRTFVTPRGLKYLTPKVPDRVKLRSAS